MIAIDENHKLIWKRGTKIWYTTTDNKIYDLDEIIEMFPSIGATYNGPAVVSNEYDKEKQMWRMTFDDVTVLGDINMETKTAEGPFFATNLEYHLACNVETIVLPKTITRIGNYTFAYCSALTSVTIPNSVTSIGKDAFYGCSSLPIIDNLRYADTYLVEAVNNGLSSYTIKDGTKWIGDYAFIDCSSLTSVTIPNSVTSIGDHAFLDCSSLTSVTIPNSVTSIGEGAFGGCSSLISVTIPNSVTSIGDHAFMWCSSLTSVTCEAITPPELGSAVFYNTNDCPIYVPFNSVEEYKTSWSEYEDRIQAISE